MKKKKELLLLGVLFAMVIVLGAFLWYTKTKKNEDAETGAEKEASTISLVSLKPEEISFFHYSYDGTDMTFIKNNEKWVLEDDKNRPINQTYVNNMVKLISNVKAVRIINEAPENLSEYGLITPYIFVEAKGQNGENVTFIIGDDVPNGSGYYAMVNDDPVVYLVATTYGSGFNYKDSDMTAIENAPVIGSDTIYHILVEQKDKETFEVKYDPENTADYSGLSLYPWVIPQPYEQVLTGDGTAVNEAIAKFTKISYDSCVDYNCEDLSIYGLDTPKASIFIEYFRLYTVDLDEPYMDSETGEEVTTRDCQEEAGYKLFVGNLDENGFYYCMPEGANEVYTVKQDTIDEMLAVTSFSCINPYIHLVNIDQVDHIDIIIEDKLYSLEIKRTDGKDEEGNDTVIASYYCNHQVVTEEAFKNMYQVLVSAKYDTEIRQDLSKELTPYVSITFYLNNGREPLETNYIPYNDSFYIVDNGMCRFYADARRIDNIVKTVTELKESNQ